VAYSAAERVRLNRVQVNAIAPGYFPDPVTWGEQGLRRDEELVARIVPLGRPGLLREVWLLALYLASPASDDMTGQTIFLDGGLSL
jgi:NAD(P)-dependent dehydrogenase (short-subunit alcohol dehydrogenase family)